MDGTKRFRPRYEIKPVEQSFIKRLSEVTRAAQCLFTKACNIPRSDSGLLGLSVDRENSSRAVADQIDNRVRHLALPAVELELAEKDCVKPRLQLLLSKWLSKERDIHRRSAVCNSHDDHRLALACAALRRAFHVDQNRCLFAYFKIGDLRFFRAIDIAAWVMRQHIENRTNAHLSKRGRLCRANTFELACRQVGELRQPTSHDLAHSIPKR